MRNRISSLLLFALLLCTPLAHGFRPLVEYEIIEINEAKYAIVDFYDHCRYGLSIEIRGQQHEIFGNLHVLERCEYDEVTPTSAGTLYHIYGEAPFREYYAGYTAEENEGVEVTAYALTSGEIHYSYATESPHEKYGFGQDSENAGLYDMINVPTEFTGDHLVDGKPYVMPIVYGKFDEKLEQYVLNPDLVSLYGLTIPVYIKCERLCLVSDFYGEVTNECSWNCRFPKIKLKLREDLTDSQGDPIECKFAPMNDPGITINNKVGASGEIPLNTFSIKTLEDILNEADQVPVGLLSWQIDEYIDRWRQMWGIAIRSDNQYYPKKFEIAGCNCDHKKYQEEVMAEMMGEDSAAGETDTATKSALDFEGATVSAIDTEDIKAAGTTTWGDMFYTEYTGDTTDLMNYADQSEESSEVFSSAAESGKLKNLTADEFGNPVEQTFANDQERADFLAQRMNETLDKINPDQDMSAKHIAPEADILGSQAKSFAEAGRSLYDSQRKSITDVGFDEKHEKYNDLQFNEYLRPDELALLDTEQQNMKTSEYTDTTLADAEATEETYEIPNVYMGGWGLWMGDSATLIVHYQKTEFLHWNYGWNDGYMGSHITEMCSAKTFYLYELDIEGLDPVTCQIIYNYTINADYQDDLGYRSCLRLVSLTEEFDISDHPFIRAMMENAQDTGGQD